MKKSSKDLFNRGYKTYVATLTQSGTNAPEAIELENNLGTITFTYEDVGYYLGTCTGKFADRTKCIIFIGKKSFAGNVGIYTSRETIVDVNDNNSFYIFTAYGGNMDNNILDCTPIEIRVYE